jgi:hypothetical protein
LDGACGAGGEGCNNFVVTIVVYVSVNVTAVLFMRLACLVLGTGVFIWLVYYCHQGCSEFVHLVFHMQDGFVGGAHDFSNVRLYGGGHPLFGIFF